MKKILITLLLITYSALVHAQEYFDDLQGNGFPVILNPAGGNFNARLNVKDNSLKVSFFRFFKYTPVFSGVVSKADSSSQITIGAGTLLPSAPPQVTLPKYVKSTGAGFSIKGKTEQNIGSLFSGGIFSPGTVISGYLASRKTILNHPSGNTKINTWLISAQYSASSLRLFDTSRVFEEMKIDTAFNGFSGAITFFQATSIGKNKEDNLIWGASLEFATKSNYSTLKAYEIKDFEKQITDPVTGSTRTVQIADEDGYGYSSNNYRVKKYVTLRPHINYIPKFLNYRAGVIFYPSYVIVEKSKPRTNFELAFHILEKDMPSLSNLAIYFSLTDVFNGREIEDKTFMGRSFSVGIGASFNMFTGKQK